jgi:OmpA-OmpF porin, OOP family
MMFRSLLLAGAAAAVLSVPAVAKPSGWYVGLAGGYSVIEDTQAFNGPPGGPFTIPGNIYQMDGGWAVLGTLGHRWSTNWRLEAEIGYRSNDGDQLTPLGVPIPGLAVGIDEWSFMGNAFFDFPVSAKMTISVGAGLGGDLITLNDGPLEIDDTVLAGQLIAQVGYMVSSRVELYADYRYLVLDEPELEFGGTGRSFEVDKHTALIGLRYDLYPDAMPVVVAPPPPPPPPPPPMKQFVVFFGFNKFNLTADAQAVVAEAAAQAKSQGAASIMVVGHTDTSGSPKYNQKLSEKRAKSVSDELVRLGIAPSMISASGRGETELLVQTGDGVKEPQNRRATIDLK